jgi:hypothetical protein
LSNSPFSFAAPKHPRNETIAIKMPMQMAAMPMDPDNPIKSCAEFEVMYPPPAMRMIPAS